MKIDVHAHYIPESCLELQEAGSEPGALVGDMTDLRRRLRDMVTMGVDVQAISPWLGFLNVDLATARRINEGMAEAVNLYPARFIGLAAVPMSSPMEATAELERAVKELDLRGVEIGSNVGRTNLDAKEFAPFYAKAQELGVPVFIHPVESPITVPVAGEAVPRGPVPEVWNHSYDGGYGDDSITAVALDGTGNPIVAGYKKGSRDPDEYATAFLHKFGENGWDRTLQSHDRLNAVAVDGLDHILVTGVRRGSLSGDGYHQAISTCKYTPEGTLSWETIHFNSPWNSGRGIAVDTADNVYVVGDVYTSPGVAHEWAILKYDSGGMLQTGFPIQMDFGNVSNAWDVAHAVEVDAEGNFIVAGQRGVAGGDVDWHVRKYRPDRSLMWEDTYGGAAGLFDIACGVAVDSLGDVVVCGHENRGADNESQADHDWLIVKYRAADGQRLWTQRHESAPGRSEICYAVAVDGLDHLLAVGYLRDEAGLLHWHLLRLNGGDGSVMSHQTWPADQSQVLEAIAYRDRTLALGGSRSNGTDWDTGCALCIPLPARITGFHVLSATTANMQWHGAMEKVAIMNSSVLPSLDWQPLTLPLKDTNTLLNLPTNRESYFRLEE